MAKTKQIARRAPCMTAAQQKKRERDEERLKQAYEKDRAREIARAAKVLKDAPAEARATRSGVESVAPASNKNEI
jgi:hypothetical protein